MTCSNPSFLDGSEHAWCFTTMDNDWLVDITAAPQQQKDGKQVDFGRWLPRWAILLAIAFLGLVLIVAPSVFAWHRDYGVLHDIGIAFLSASIIGFTIDAWLKSDLSKDVFTGAVGYFLREASGTVGCEMLH